MRSLNLPAKIKVLGGKNVADWWLLLFEETVSPLITFKCNISKVTGRHQIIVDSRSYHEENVTILKLPPHISHALQPLDLSVFKSLKTCWVAQLVKWRRKNIGVKLPKSYFSRMIRNVLIELKLTQT